MSIIFNSKTYLQHYLVVQVFRKYVWSLKALLTMHRYQLLSQFHELTQFYIPETNGKVSLFTNLKTCLKKKKKENPLNVTITVLCFPQRNTVL